MFELGGSSREEKKLVSPVCWYNSGVDVFQLTPLQALFLSLYKKKVKDPRLVTEDAHP